MPTETRKHGNCDDRTSTCCNHEHGKHEAHEKCAHGERHDHNHDHGRKHDCGCTHDGDHAHNHNDHECGCGHHEHQHDHSGSCCHKEHHHPKTYTVAIHLGSALALCRLSNHEGALIASCTLELEGAHLTPALLAKALQHVASKIESEAGIVGHIKCTATDDTGTAHISVTQASVDPTIIVNGIDVFSEEAEINIVIIEYGIEHADLLTVFADCMKAVL